MEYLFYYWIAGVCWTLFAIAVTPEAKNLFKECGFDDYIIVFVITVWLWPRSVLFYAGLIK